MQGAWKLLDPKRLRMQAQRHTPADWLHHANNGAGQMAGNQGNSPIALSILQGGHRTTWQHTPNAHTSLLSMVSWSTHITHHKHSINSGAMCSALSCLVWVVFRTVVVVGT